MSCDEPTRSIKARAGHLLVCSLATLTMLAAPFSAAAQSNRSFDARPLPGCLGGRNQSRDVPPRSANEMAASQASAALKTGNYELALALWNQIDESDPRAISDLSPSTSWVDLRNDREVGAVGAARVGLVRLYEEGQGVRQSYAEAAKWYEKTVQTKFVDDRKCVHQPYQFHAMERLGLFYVYGLGVQKNQKRSRELFDSEYGWPEIFLLKIRGFRQLMLNISRWAVVLADMGLAVVSEWMFAPELADGRVVEVLPEWELPPMDLWAVYPSGRRASAKARGFVDHVQATLNATCGLAAELR
jgi:hypothetical protein